MKILEKYLEIESREELYEFVFSHKDTLMYPFIRFRLLQSALEATCGIPSPYDPLHFGNVQKLKYITKSFLYTPNKQTRATIVFFGSDVSNICKENAYFNRLTESFANEYPSETILFEASDKMDYKRPRTYPNVFAKDFVKITARFKSILKSVNSEDLDKIDSFINFLKNHFNNELNDIIFWELKKSLIRFVKELPFLFDEYIKLIKKLTPKIIFLEDACYGEGSIPLIMAAKELKIPIGEFQHGLISLTHPAYNYSDKLLDNYKFYMSYGEYWTKNSRLPIKVVNVGNPYLSETTQRHDKGQKKELLLYVSSAITPEQYVKEVIYLNRKMADTECSVVFRIHPSESHRLQNVYKPIVDAGITVDTQPLYETLKHSKYVIGDISTTLFEAPLFDCITFVKDTPYNRENLDISYFNSCSSVEKLVENIRSKNFKKTDSNSFWSENWRIKYHQLIDSYL